MKNFTRGISATNWHPARSADIFWDELGLSFFCAYNIEGKITEC